MRFARTSINASRPGLSALYYETVTTRIGVRLVLLIAIGATIGCDRVTKHAAAITLSEAPGRSFLADTVRLEYVENTGAFLGLGADWPYPARAAIFGLGNGLLLAALVLVASRGRWPPRALLGTALVVAGGGSNLVDRITHGMVIDFVNVGIGSLRTGIFNVADIAIMVGAAILMLEAYRLGRPAPSTNSD
jgi:signal peptidase II